MTLHGGYLYAANGANNCISRIDPATGTVTKFFAGDGASGSTDGTGTAARFNNPWGIVSDGTYLYVADTYNRTVRQVDPVTAVVTTLAGAAGGSGTADGTGADARFNNP